MENQDREEPSAREIAVAALAKMYDPQKQSGPRSQFTGSAADTQFKGKLKLSPRNGREVVNQMKGILDAVNPADAPKVSDRYDAQNAVLAVTVTGSVAPHRKAEFEATLAKADQALMQTLQVEPAAQGVTARL